MPPPRREEGGWDGGAAVVGSWWKSGRTGSTIGGRFSFPGGCKLESNSYVDYYPCKQVVPHNHNPQLAESCEFFS